MKHIIEITPELERRVTEERRRGPRERIAALEKELEAMKKQRSTEAIFVVLARGRLFSGLFHELLREAKEKALAGK